jgi:oligoendopeptidase F
MYHESTDRAQKIFFLQQMIKQGSEVFRAWEALFEQQMFDSVALGKALRADDLEAMMQKTGSRFSIWFAPDSEKKLAWLQPTQFFTRPLYCVNYVYAKLLALHYLDSLHRDADGFPQRYEALLRNGYDAPPDALLRQFVGVSLGDPALIASATRVLESWLEELDRRYKS